MANHSTLQFLGGVGTVTGSRFLIRTGNTRILVDAGLFQGRRELRERNWHDLPFDVSTIDAVVITHAHVDHCGYVPRLMTSGYSGPVYVTESTADLMGIVLPDCGYLQEEEAGYANRSGFSRHEPALPLYTEEDARQALDLLRPLAFGGPHELPGGVRLHLSRSGHILGSATVALDLPGGTRVGISGDLGRASHPLFVPPDPPPEVDVLLVESTYGDRRHDDAGSLDRLADAISRTVERGGSVLIPAFAVDRTEVLLHHLACLAESGRIPRGVPVYVDSPMALDALKVYRGAIDRGDPEIQIDGRRDRDPFDVPMLREVRSVEESKALNAPNEPSIIISASGMASGGRVVHHLAHLLPDPVNTVILVGFQAEGTRGRRLVDGETELKMLGRYVRVRAEVVDLPAFSVHADAGELVDWVDAARTPPDLVYVVHGESTASAALAGAIERRLDIAAVVPSMGERVRLDPLR